MKLAVIFPGIGYHTDKPLLYYGKKLARESGYQIIEVNYTGFPQNVKGNEKKMKQSTSLHLSLFSLKNFTNQISLNNFAL